MLFVAFPLLFLYSLFILIFSHFIIYLFIIIFKFIYFIYLFLAELGLRCCAWAFF